MFASRNLAAQHLQPEPAACLGPAGAVSRHGIDNGMPGKLSGGEITVKWSSSDRPGLQTPAGEHLLGKARLLRLLNSSPALSWQQISEKPGQLRKLTATIWRSFQSQFTPRQCATCVLFPYLLSERKYFTYKLPNSHKSQYSFFIDLVGFLEKMRVLLRGWS